MTARGIDPVTQAFLLGSLGRMLTDTIRAGHDTRELVDAIAEELVAAGAPIDGGDPR